MNSKEEEDQEQTYVQSLSLPAGFRFKPLDHELIYYLKRKINDQPLPLPPNVIIDVELYNYDPDTLTKNCTNKTWDGRIDEWYFFTPRDRKYPNGTRPGRAAGNGYWKSTGCDKHIMFKGKTVGLRRSLVFMRGKSPKAEKTNWLMHEYILPNNKKNNIPPATADGDHDKRLDKWVVCRVYKRGKDVKPNDKTREVGVEDSIPNLTETQNQEPEIFSPSQFDPQRHYLQFEQHFNNMPSYNYAALDTSSTSAFGAVLPPFPESLEHPLILKHDDSTMFPQQQQQTLLMSNYGANFIPTALPVTSMAPDPDPQQFYYMDNRYHDQQHQQNVPAVSNNFEFSGADQFISQYLWQ